MITYIKKTLLMLLILTSFIQAKDFNHSIFDRVLKKYVNENGRVDYKGIKSDKLFEEYLTLISNADITALTQEERLAFYINSYNAYVIKNVLNNWPIKSPLSVNEFFKKFKFPVAGEYLSLDEIEHKYVFPIEPVISHFGLVCGALSCPKLIRKAYTGDNVKMLLEVNGSIFLNDTFKNIVDRENKTLRLSQVFKWFGNSFKSKFGNLINTAKQYINQQDREFLDKNEVKIEFMKYDWTLNKQ